MFFERKTKVCDDYAKIVKDFSKVNYICIIFWKKLKIKHSVASTCLFFWLSEKIRNSLGKECKWICKWAYTTFYFFRDSWIDWKEKLKFLGSSDIIHDIWNIFLPSPNSKYLNPLQNNLNFIFLLFLFLHSSSFPPSLPPSFFCSFLIFSQCINWTLF